MTNKPIDMAVAKAELERIDAVLRTPHLLIGGLAVQQYHPARMSRDIDLVCDFKTARRLLDRLYPSLDWKVVDKQNDEYRPSFQITHKVDDVGTIIFGPKITERAPYEHVNWHRLADGARPFRGRAGALENILVPAAHALAYTKFISFLGRRAPDEKVEADLRDFADLSNHDQFSVSLFFDLLRMSRSFDELCRAFQDRASTYRVIVETSCLSGIAPLFVAPSKATLGSTATALASESTNRSPVAQEVIRVTSAEEFVNAIGCNRVIEIAPTSLDLSAVPDRFLENVRWDTEHDGLSITIRNVKNLTIRGSGRAATNVMVRPRYSYVLWFEKCQNIAVSDLTMGHITPGYCKGGVLGASESEGVRVLRCSLHGSGIEGVTLRGVTAFYMEDCEVFECTYGIATIESCREIAFIRSTFRNNKKFYGVTIRDSQQVEFFDSSVISNRCQKELFEVVSSSLVRFVRGRVAGNACGGLGRIGVEGADVQGSFGAREFA